MKTEDVYAFIDKYKEDDYNEPKMEEIEDIQKCIEEGRVPIILTERVEHLQILEQGLLELNIPIDDISKSTGLTFE